MNKTETKWAGMNAHTHKHLHKQTNIERLRKKNENENFTRTHTTPNENRTNKSTKQYDENREPKLKLSKIIERLNKCVDENVWCSESANRRVESRECVCQSKLMMRAQRLICK